MERLRKVCGNVFFYNLDYPGYGFTVRVGGWSFRTLVKSTFENQLDMFRYDNINDNVSISVKKR